MRRGFVNPPRTPREQFYASRQNLQTNDGSSKRGNFWNQRNKQFQQYCTARREIANVRDNGNTEKKTTKNNRRWYNPPNVQQECIYRDNQDNWNNGGQNVNNNKWNNQHESVDQFHGSNVRTTSDHNTNYREINYAAGPYRKSIVLGTLCVLTKVHKQGQRKKI